MKNYKQKKADAIARTIDWQMNEASEPMSWGELADWQEYFYKLGKRYGLLKEFRENGIL